MQKRILVLDNSIDRLLYRPTEEWSRHFGEVPFDAVHVPSSEPIPPLARYTHVLITGSDARLSGHPEAWFDAEAKTIRDAVGRELAVLGSCFGHQMLAWSLSGAEYVRSAPIPELGWVAIDVLAADPLLSDLPNPWHTFAGHLDEVVAPPDPWRVLASNDACAVQVMRYGDRPVWGIQPHPETPPEEARAQMRAALEEYPEFAREITEAIESPVRDDRTTPRLVRSFLRF
jgi:GMP synthase-like glutamine amidotransferase